MIRGGISRGHRPVAGTDDGEPCANCRKCSRLAHFRDTNSSAYPDFYNAPVPSFGASGSRLLIVGLAPGLKGANRTGRPFTGDYAGDLLYATLLDFGFAAGRYEACADDGLALCDTMITNAVRCVPPQNKPTPEEIRTCRAFLVARLRSLRHLRVILVLGRVAHDSTIAALDLKRKDYPFAHGRRHHISDQLALFDSFHCSRYNTNTGRLTEQMFRDVFEDVRAELSVG